MSDPFSNFLLAKMLVWSAVLLIIELWIIAEQESKGVPSASPGSIPANPMKTKWHCLRLGMFHPSIKKISSGSFTLLLTSCGWAALCGWTDVLSLLHPLGWQSYLCNRLWRPIGLWDVKAPTISRQSADRWQWSCQPYVPTTLYSQEDYWNSFLLRGWKDEVNWKIQWPHWESNPWPSSLYHSASIYYATTCLHPLECLIISLWASFFLKLSSGDPSIEHWHLFNVVCNSTLLVTHGWFYIWSKKPQSGCMLNVYWWQFSP
jgi:hypothetical protein